MIELRNLYIDKEWFRIEAEQSSRISAKLLSRTITDLAKEVEQKAKEFAPIGSPPPLGSSRKPGELKAHGVLREPTHSYTLPGGDAGVAGSEVTEFPAYGGGFSVRGGNLANRGQFSSVSKFREPGYIFSGGYGRTKTFVSARVVLNPDIPHARWVHEGTGVYGRYHTPIIPTIKPYLVFWWHGRRWYKTSVKGQPPQPFLTEAYAYVNDVYAPAKLSELRAELSAL